MCVRHSQVQVTFQEEEGVYNVCGLLHNNDYNCVNPSMTTCIVSTRSGLLTAPQSWVHLYFP